MGMIHYELVKHIEEIIPIVKKYIKILSDFRQTGKEEDGGRVIDTFVSFDYWYFFDNVSVLDGLDYIFIPNKFLGYLIHSKKPYNPPQVMNGEKAKNALSPFFDVIIDEDRNNTLYSELYKFAEKYGNGVKKNVTILEPKQQYNDELGSQIVNKENNLHLNSHNVKMINELDLVNNVIDIIPIIQKYKQYLIDGEPNNGTLFQNFRSFDYWYHFPMLNIFIPNKFLGYKVHAVKYYNPEHGMNGTKAKNALEPFFNVIPKDSKFDIFNKLELFVQKCNQKSKKGNKGITIFEPNGNLRNLLQREMLNNKIMDNNEDNSIHNSKSTILTKEFMQSESSEKNSVDSTSFPEAYKIAQKAEDKKNKINKDCMNHKKPLLFENIQEESEIWKNIRTPCVNHDDFGRFIRALYMLFFDTTKDKEHTENLMNKGKPNYIKRLPRDFTKSNTPTWHFMDIIGILRHTFGEGHPESKLQLPEWKISKSDALQELVNSRFEPQTTKEYQILQIEILKLFEESMERLDQMVKKELKN